ncbi:MAG: hypothetical protein WBP41_06530 [Saprospiraceae bacterium]
MANITMADYVGFIFSEITRARGMADRESIRIAEMYAQNDVLKHFSVPRFKIPEMNLTIPVIISGAKFSTTLVFNMELNDFKNFIINELNNATKHILIKKTNINNDFTVITNNDIFLRPIFDTNFVIRPIRLAAKKLNLKKGVPLKAAAADGIISDFYEQLKSSTDPAHPENIVQVKWATLFNMNITDNKLLDDYNKQNPNGELYKQTLANVIEKIKSNTVVSATKIDNLLVDPETNNVKTISTESTVFLINAKIMEEGIFVKFVKGQNGEPDTQVVEFE